MESRRREKLVKFHQNFVMTRGHFLNPGNSYIIILDCEILRIGILFTGYWRLPIAYD